MPTADTLRQQLATALPPGTDSRVVATYLEREGVEHSALAEPGLSKHGKAQPGERVINAAIREPAKGAVSRTLTIEFRFDTAGKLVATDVREQFTGP